MSVDEPPPDTPLVESLTRREREILGLLDQGLSAPEMAEKLTLGLSSVKTHVQHVYSKLGVSGKRPALARARELGLLGAAAGQPPPAGSAQPAAAAASPGSAEPAEPAAPEPGESPFQGLRYFTEAEAALFFGREALVARLAGRLTAAGGATRFLAVVGASGSGKSSLVRAGLVPALRHATGPSFLPGVRFDPIHIITPTARPLEALAASLTRQSESVASAATLLDDLARDGRALSLHARRLYANDAARGVQPNAPAPGRLLLVVDQFEELFTLCRSEAERQAFIDNLMTAAAPEGPITVVVAMRADFYPHCAAYARLREALASQQEYVGPMDNHELRRAVEEPARLGGWAFEPGLVDQILRDVSDQPGRLPLLSHALLETWRHRRGRTLTLRSYAEAGRVQAAIATTAEDVLQSLAPDEQAIARGIFLRLTALGEGTQDTRRRVSAAELLPTQSGGPAAAASPTARVLQLLSDARLITLDDDVVEVAHEALIREWPTLRQWLSEDRDGLRLHRRLTEAAQAWDELERDPSELYRGPRLGQALDWEADHAAELNPLEQEFMSASLAQVEQEAAQHEAQQQRELEAARALAAAESDRAAAQSERAEAETRRAAAQVRATRQLRWLAAALALFFVASSGLALFAFGQRATAQANLNQAEQQRLAAQASDVLSTGSADLAALLALQSLKFGYSPIADGALLRALSRPFARHIWSVKNQSIGPIAFSPDGHYIAAGAGDGIVRIWDIASGSVVQSLAMSPDWINSIAFSPDGQKLLVAGASDPVAQVWDLKSGQVVLRLVGHTGAVLSAAYSPAGDKIVTGSNDGQAIVWDALTARRLLTVTASITPFGQTTTIIDISFVRFSPDGRYFITIYAWTVFLWDTQTGKNVQAFSGHLGPVTHAAFTPDGQKLVTTSVDGTARVFDVASGAELRQIPVGGGVAGVDVSPDGDMILTGGAPNIAQLWDLGTGQELQRFVGNGSNINSVAFAPDGQSVATGGDDGTVRLWDIHITAEPRQLAGHYNQITGLAISPDGRYALSSSRDPSAKIWDLQSGQVKLNLFGQDNWMQSVDWSPDSKTVLTSGLDGTIQTWDAATGQPGWAFHETGLDEFFTRAIYSPDGQHIAVVGLRNHTVEILSARTGRIVHWPGGLANDVNDMAFSADGRYLVTTGRNHLARLWNFASGQQVRTFASDAGAVAISPDGRFLVTAEPDKTARVWEVASGKQVWQLTGHSGDILAVAFSADSRYVLTGSADKTVRLWDLATGQEVRQFIGSDGAVRAVAFGRDGKTVLTGGEDDVVRVWRTDYREAMALACARLQRDFTDEERQLYHISSSAPTCPAAAKR